MIEIFKENKERIITGFSLLGLAFLIGIIDNFFVMWVIFGGTYLLAFKEAMVLFDLDDERLFLFAGGIWLVAGIYPHGDALFILAAISYAGAVAYKPELEYKNFLPFMYPTAGMLFILTMYQEYGVFSLLWLLGIVALSDVGAYIVGKSIGKTQFCETSPNKTLEGVFGGIIVATFGGMFLGLTLVDLGTAFLISLVVAVSAIFGDLFESALKRKANVKDSGDILPGHGGILDRVDGYLFGSVVMLVLLRSLV
ncbi:MAG: phosphatidate cytidylyltransferase [Sulfurimonas sp.]|nr:phosphatidate cytidylyltransferase [Sulfurimonas sp.]PHQ92536.1 MAG: phosphatidate cytidylyltransferase [Sulfurimonas sp.]